MPLQGMRLCWSNDKSEESDDKSVGKNKKITLSLVCLCWSYDNKRCECRYDVAGLLSVGVVQSERVKMGDAGTPLPHRKMMVSCYLCRVPKNGT